MNNVISDVVKRTNGEIYLGIVGSVRSGKSTFIRRFMELKVLPYLNDETLIKRITDELPQSGAGKQIMTVEPKFVPSTTVDVNVNQEINFKVRLVDCVGFIIDGASGYLNDDGSSRVVQTPWFSEGIPFVDAAEIGTKKVIENHTNIGIVLTSDGSFGEFSRNDYEEVEEKVIEELKELNKPFVIVVNSINPNAEKTLKLVEELKNKYHNEVISLNVQDMTEDDVDKLLYSALSEFDITDIEVNIPKWLDVASDESAYKMKFNEVIKEVSGKYRKIKDILDLVSSLKESALFEDVTLDEIHQDTGEIKITIGVNEAVYDEIISDLLGVKINDKADLLKALNKYHEMTDVYNKFGNTFSTLNNQQTDIIFPHYEELELSNPEMIKAGSRYGVKVVAKAPLTIITKINVESKFEPIIGSADQAKALVEQMTKNYETDPMSILDLSIFGRKLSDVIIDGINSKAYSDNGATLVKFRDALEKVINEGNGGIIAFML